MSSVFCSRGVERLCWQLKDLVWFHTAKMESKSNQVKVYIGFENKEDFEDKEKKNRKPFKVVLDW